MKREGLFDTCFALVFFAVIGAIGFAWMYVLLDVLVAPPTITHLVVSAILGPLLSIGWIVLVFAGGNNTLLEMTLSGSLPVGPVALLAALHYWTSLSLAWSIPIALILGLPAGLVIGLGAVAVFGSLGDFLWKIGHFFFPGLKLSPPPPSSDPDFDPDDISGLLRRPDDPDWECHEEGCHEPIVKYTRLCRKHLQQSAMSDTED